MEDAEGDVEEAAVDKKVNHINKYCKKEYLLHNFSDVLKRLMQSNWIRTN